MKLQLVRTLALLIALLTLLSASLISCGDNGSSDDTTTGDPNAGNPPVEYPTVTVADISGNTVVSFTPSKSYACVIISTPKLVSGQTYCLTVGTNSGDVVAN